MEVRYEILVSLDHLHVKPDPIWFALEMAISADPIQPIHSPSQMGKGFGNFSKIGYGLGIIFLVKWGKGRGWV